MIIDVTKSGAKRGATLLVSTTFLAAASLCCSYLQAANTTSVKTEAEVETILALTADPEYGAYLAGECQTCHTADGSDSSIPGFEGRDADYIVTALIQYKNRERQNETMRSVASALGNEEMAAIAAYFSNLPK